jgi:chromosome segregation ATPase
MATSNNPAGRLHGILREAKRQEDRLSVRAAWAAVFGFEENEIAKIYAHLAELSELLIRAESEFRLLDVRHDVYLKHFPALKLAILAANLDEQWKQKKAQLTEHALDALEICSERLEMMRPESVVDTEKLEELRSEIASLFATIETSEIPSELRSVLLGMLNSMQEALSQYRMRGVEGLRQEWFHIRARLERHAEAILDERSNPVVIKFMSALGHWSTLSSVYLNTKQLWGEVTKLLGPGN